TLHAMKQQINQKPLSFPPPTLNPKHLQIPLRLQQKVPTIHPLNKIHLKSTINPQPHPLKLRHIPKLEPLTEQREYT
ncbi:hypothetical protein, partial [Priestia megaterium]|uniref:hypothetical protein n=1 Tax=Priestia megaterium TaxID=1404 RepID=UPI001F442E2A